MLNSHHSDDFSPLDFVDDILEFGVVGGCVCKRWTHGARCNDHDTKNVSGQGQGRQGESNYVTTFTRDFLDADHRFENYPVHTLWR